MARFFVSITISDLQAKIDKKAIGHHDVVQALQEILEKDLKVQFDCENTYCSKAHWKESEFFLGYHTLLNGLTFLGCAAGGDWEYPVCFICYWDGKKLRGYIPTEGNWYNTDTMWAFGNSDESGDPLADSKNIKKRWYPDWDGDEDPDDAHFETSHIPDFDFKAMIKDIEARILPSGTTPQKQKPGCPGTKLPKATTNPIVMGFSTYAELEGVLARMTPAEKKHQVVFCDGNDITYLSKLQVDTDEVAVHCGDSICKGHPYLW